MRNLLCLLILLFFPSCYAQLYGEGPVYTLHENSDVVYRGLINELSLGDIEYDSFEIDGAGFYKGEADAILCNPKSGRSVELKISITNKGRTENFTQIFKIEDIVISPSYFAIKKYQLDGKIKRSQLQHLTLKIDGDLSPYFNVEIGGFKINVPGFPVFEIKGNKVDENFIRMIPQFKRGQQIQVFEIYVVHKIPSNILICKIGQPGELIIAD